MVELYCHHRMTMKRVVMVIASLWINCDCQRFTSVSEKQDVPLGANVSLIWNFDVESGIFETGLWSNTQGTNVMSKFGNETSETLPGFKAKIVPYGQYGMTVLNIMEEDSGAYTAVFAIGVGGSTVPFPEKAYIQGHNVSVPLDFVMYIEGNSTNNTESGATVNVTVVAPPNDPPSINVSITIYTDKKSVSRDWPNSDETMPRSLDFEVPSHKWLKVEACLSHPAVSNETCKEEQFTIQDKGPDDPGAECKWWCILLIVLAVLAILGIIVGLMYHYRLACFRSKSSAQIDVNQKQETNGFGMENKAY